MQAKQHLCRSLSTQPALLPSSPDADNDANFPASKLFAFLNLHNDIGDGDIGDAVGDIGDEDIPIDARQTTGDSREYKCEDTKSSSSETPLLELLG